MRVPSRKIRTKLEANENVFGVTIQLPSPDAVEMAGYVGMDFVWIDAEHGTLDLGDINTLLRAADAAQIDAIVRVPDHNPSFIQRVLDAGATGIMAPHVRTLADSKAIVDAAKFSPEGSRGACPSTRSVGHVSLDWARDYRRANQDVLVFGLIEDQEGVDNVDEIARESGLDGLVFGPFDLAQSCGLEGNIAHATIEQMHSKVTSATRNAGIEYISLPAWEFGGFEALAKNSRIFNVTGDRGVLYMGFRAALANVQAGLQSVSTAAAQMPGLG